MGYSPWGRKESDTTEQLHIHLSRLLCPVFFTTHWAVLLSCAQAGGFNMASQWTRRVFVFRQEHLSSRLLSKMVPDTANEGWGEIAMN